MGVLIDCKNIHFKYKNLKALKDINLRVESGDFIMMIGPNGGGKSTLAKILLGILKPEMGEIFYPSEEFNKNSIIGYMPQETNTNKDFPITALDVVLMGFLEKRYFGFRILKTHRLKALEIMDSLSIAHIANKKLCELSGGQRQRVLIARSLCGNPKLLILDEPTSNIDSATQKKIFELLKELNKNHTIITITHDISIINNKYANKILFVNQTITNTININDTNEDSIDIKNEYFT